jgi:hypothetical protein
VAARIEGRMTFQELESVWVEFNESLMQAIAEKESAGEIELHIILGIYFRLSSLGKQIEELRSVLRQEAIDI